MCAFLTTLLKIQFKVTKVFNQKTQLTFILHGLLFFFNNWWQKVIKCCSLKIKPDNQTKKKGITLNKKYNEKYPIIRLSGSNDFIKNIHF